MQLKKIQERFARFKDWLESPASQDTLFIWEAQSHFQHNWNLEISALAEMIDASLDSRVSRRMWSRENYAPKAMMLEFARMEPEMVRMAFRTLFDETKDVEVRIDRFIYYCNELLKDYKSKTFKPLFNRHFQDDDFAMISLYLAFRYPESYSIYAHRAFVEMLRNLGSPELPQAPDPARYFKVAKTLYNMIQKDPELVSLHLRRFKAGDGQGLLIVYEFCLMDSDGLP